MPDILVYLLRWKTFRFNAYTPNRTFLQVLVFLKSLRLKPINLELWKIHYSEKKNRYFFS